MTDRPITDRHVLIVDDEELYRELLGGRLGRQGYRISEAGDGEGALRCIEGGGVELALID
ncbi:MAG: hypothetical protein JNL62_29865, partial [Bryobacterales bacterium]|nr:hypothetical protein [Bryobacterales bacterium]